MSTKRLHQSTHSVKARARISAAILEHQEVHAEMGTPCEMFPSGDDLPIFSGVPMSVEIGEATNEPGATQGKFAECSICFDTGSVRVGGVLRRCWCKTGEQQDVRDALLSTTSRRLARVQHNAPNAYDQGDDTEHVMKEAAIVQPISGRFLSVGPASMSDAELLTVILGEQTTVLASRLIAKFQTLARLYHLDRNELMGIKGMTPKRAAVLQCAIGLAYRVNSTPEENPYIKSPADAAELLRPDMQGLDQEQMHVLIMNTKNRVIGHDVVYKGSVHTTVIRVGEMFKAAIRANAPAIIIAHNHPSGDPTPSPEDVAVTHEIVKAGKVLDIELLDHLVIGDGQRFVSLKERGLGF